MPILDFSQFPILTAPSADAPTPIPALLAQIDVETTRLRFRGLDFVARDERECSGEELERVDELARGIRVTRSKDRAELLALKQAYLALELGEPSRIKLALMTYALLKKHQGDASELSRSCEQRAAEL